MVRRFRRLLSCAALAAACAAPVHAAELGDVRVASHIGQPLVADIELAMLEDAATPVGVRIADREVYGGAGIAVPPVLSSLNLTVMRRDGRQFLHLTSLRPVDADHVHLYLELADKGQRTVRLATLWLTPDPNPVAVAVAAAAPSSSPAAAPAALVPAPPQKPARPSPVAHAAPAAAPAPLDKAPAPIRPAPVVAAEAAAKHALPAPLAKPLPFALPLSAAHSHPAACTASGDAQACTMLGTKNAELRAQLGRLEDKVKVLQAKLGVTPAVHGASPVQAHPDPAGAPRPAAAPLPAPAAEQGAGEARPAPPDEAGPPVPAKPKAIHSIKPLVAHKPKTPPLDESLPWTWIGAAAGVLALAGAGIALAVGVRRRRSRNVDIPAASGWLARLKRRFAARTGAPASVAAVPVPGPAHAEPTLE